VKTLAAFDQLRSFAASQRHWLAAGMAATAVDTFTALALPWFAGQFAAGLFGPSAAWNPSSVLILLAVLFAVQALSRFSATYSFGRASNGMAAELRVRMHDHLQALPLAYFQARRQGDVLAVLAYDLPRISSYTSGPLVGVPLQLLAAFGAVVLMWKIDWKVAALAATCVPVLFLVIKVVGRRLRPIATDLYDEQGKAFALAEEHVTMLPMIKAFTREREATNDYTKLNNNIARLEAKQQLVSSAMGPGVQWLASMALIAILWLASDRVGAGALSTAALVTLLLYAAALARPVSGLADFYGQTQQAKAALARVMAVFSAKGEDMEPESVPVARARGDIHFDDVTFAYPERPAVLTGFNLNIEAGETVALTGENGAGKSTLVHLLLRLIEPQAGQILVDQKPLTDWHLHSLRSQIGLVSQHVYLFNGSVRENIAWGRAGASGADVERAAREAQAHDFVTLLPEGYETMIGDQGVRLSGGQRQRIALARALLKDPPILVLDEATSMFDPEGEAHFIADCREGLRKRTVIIITHRPAALALADRVIRMPRANH